MPRFGNEGIMILFYDTAASSSMLKMPLKANGIDQCGMLRCFTDPKMIELSMAALQPETNIPKF